MAPAATAVITPVVALIVALSVSLELHAIVSPSPAGVKLVGVTFASPT